MKFPTKVLALSLVCMNMVTGALDSYLSSSDTNPQNYDKNMGMEPEDITTNSQNHDTNAMTPEDIQGLKEYEKLSEVCEELNNLLRNKVIKDFSEIPYETATKVDNAIENVLKKILPKGSPENDMYSAKYWINKIIDNPEDDPRDYMVKTILRHPSEYKDSIDGGPCDYWVTDILYLLTPYINGNKKSNINARSVLGQMMLKITTKEKLKKLALMMILSSFFSGGNMASYDFLVEYGLKKDLLHLYNLTKNKPDNHNTYDIYFEDEKLKDLIQKVKRHYIYICEEYLN